MLFCVSFQDHFLVPSMLYNIFIISFYDFLTVFHCRILPSCFRYLNILSIYILWSIFSVSFQDHSLLPLIFYHYFLLYLMIIRSWFNSIINPTQIRYLIILPFFNHMIFQCFILGSFHPLCDIRSFFYLFHLIILHYFILA